MNAAKVVKEMEDIAIAQNVKGEATGRRVGGWCERKFGVDSYGVRTGGSSLLWTKNDKRISRKNVIAELSAL